MAREVRWGSPGKSDHYPPLRSRWTFLGPALLAGGGALVLLLLSWGVGYRTPVSPGAVISEHAGVEARCEECHTPRAGVADVRCQRCHDPSGAGRLTNRGHVLFGSGDLRKAAGAPQVDCARCHVDHRGRTTPLTRVDEGHCHRCHFRSLSGHPEFAVLRAESTESPGIEFPHRKHVEEFAKQGVSELDSCLKCHEPSVGQGQDLEPITFDGHCASCHAKDGSVGMVEPIPETELLAPEGLAAEGRVNFKLEEFERSRGRITKVVVRHKDDWVLANLRQMRRDVDPDGFAAERGALLARESQLRRRLALSAPLAGLDLEALRVREAALEKEVKGVEGRIAGQAGAVEPPAGLARLEEVLAAAARTGDAAAAAESEDLRATLDALEGAAARPAVLPADEVEERRRELLALLEAVEAADPALKPRAEDLRRRLLALSPGEPGVDMLSRVRDQRLAERARVRDEIALRAAGVAPPAVALLAGEQRAIRDALAETRRKLEELGEPAGAPALEGEAKSARLEALGVLTAACQKCHFVDGPQMLPVHAARPVLVRANFVHKPHLLHADCAKCHAGVEKSEDAAELNFRGVESCRECHRPRSVRADCQSCHRYHPQAMP